MAVLAAGLAGGLVPAKAQDSECDDPGYCVDWTGPGYYVTDAMDYLDAGPYSNEADCKAWIATRKYPDFFDCVYFATDPFKDSGNNSGGN